METAPAQAPHLDRGIGLVRVLSQSVATMAPAASVVFGLGLIISYAGQASPFSMLVGTGAAILLALCVGQLAKHITSAGGIYSYAATALGDNVGFLVGWAYSILYMTIICLVAISFGLVGGDFLDFYFGVSVPEWVLSVGLMVLTVTVTYLGIRPSTTVTATLAIAEVGLLFVVAVLLIVRAGSDNSLALFNPSNAGFGDAGTIRAVFLGVVFAFSLISGFEASVPLAEETRDPRRTVPRAVLLAAGGIGLFYVIATYAAVTAWGTDRLGSFLDSPNPWREMAGEIGGFFALLVALAILYSQVAGQQAAFNATSRLLFAMSRNGILPRALSRLHPTRRSPHVAAVVAGGVALIATFVAKALFDGSFNAYIFFVTTMVIVFLVLYVVVSISTTALYVRKLRAEFDPFRHLVAPALSLAVLLPTLYYSVKGLTHPANLAIPAVIVWTAIGAVVLAVLRSRGLDVTAEGQRWLEGHGSEEGLEP